MVNKEVISSPVLICRKCLLPKCFFFLYFFYFFFIFPCVCKMKTMVILGKELWILCLKHIVTDGDHGLFLHSNGLPPSLTEGGGFMGKDSWTGGQGFRLCCPTHSSFRQVQSSALFFFEETWSEVLSSERVGLILSLVVLIINIMSVLKIIVLTFKRAAKIWAGHCQN